MSGLLKFPVQLLILFNFSQPECQKEKYLLSVLVTTITFFITMSHKELLLLDSSVQFVGGYF